MKNLTRICQAGLLLLALSATAVAQVHVPYSDGGYSYNGYPSGPAAGYYGGYGAQSGATTAKVPLLGRTMFSLNGAIDGLGYEGSYASAATTVPLGSDSLEGWWLLDMRASLSQEGRPFTNFGLVRRKHFSPMHADFGLGVFYDMDADEYENFGHIFHQVGVSAHMWTPYFDVNANGYVPLGSSRRIGTPDSPFYRDYLMLQYGLDSPLEGFDVEVGLRPPSLQQKNGTINLGVYSYGSADVDRFAGFQGSYSFQPKPGMRLVVGMTADDEFNTSGLLQLELWRGRSRGYTPSGRDLDPIKRRSHIVRQHVDPIFLTDPDSGDMIRVVHVDNAAPDGGNGWFESPYNSLEDADGTLPPYLAVDFATTVPRSLGKDFIERSMPGDIIFVHDGLSRIDRGLFLTPDDPTDDTPFDPTDDLPFDLTGYDTGISLLAGQQLLGDGVEHLVDTAEVGFFRLSQDLDGRVPFISNPDGAAVTLANDTTVRGFNIVNSKIGVLAPDPTRLVNNSDGITGTVTLEDLNIIANDPVFLASDFNQNTGDDADPHLVTIRIPLETGISILDSTATFNIDDVDIDGMNLVLPDQIIDPAGAGFVIAPVVEGNMVAAFNIERGAPTVNYNGMIDNVFDVQTNLVLDDGDPATVDATVFVELGELTTGGAAINIADTTLGTDITINGMVNNVLGNGIMIDNADDSLITINALTNITSSVNASVNVMNSDDSLINFANSLNIVDPTEAGVLLTDNMNSEIRFFNLTVTTPTNQAILDDGDDTTIIEQPIAGFIATRNAGSTVAVKGNSFLDIVGGPALVVSTPDGTTTTLDMNFSRLVSNSSLDGGVDLGNVAGTFKTNRTTVIDSAGPAIKVTGVGNHVNDAADLFDANFGQVVITASQPDIANPPFTTQGPGVILRENPNATFNFVTLNVTTTVGLGFQAINSGTVNFITPAIINATGGAAVDIENTIGQTNGLDGFTFERLTSIDSSDEGVRLVNMVSDFTVRGDTLIQDNAGFGIDIFGGEDVIIDFNEVNIVSRDNVGVHIRDIAGVVKFANVDIDSNLDNMGTPPTGFIDRPAGNAIDIRNTFATNGRVELNGGTILDATNDGIYIENSIATVQNMMITVSDVDLDTDDGIQVVTTGTGSSIVLLQHNVIDHPVDDTVANPTEDDFTGDNGIRLIANGTGTLSATILNNVIDSNDLLTFPADSIGALHATVESGTLHMNVVGQNNGNGEAPTDPFFLENLGGTFNVTQASAGNLSTLNNNVDVQTDGVISFGAGNPPLPPPIMP